MPTIPSLERRTVTPQTRIATVDPRGAASLGNVVGQGIKDVQGAFQEAQLKQDRYQLADAASKFSILKHQQDSAFDEDDLEYGTFVDRYTKNVDEGLSEIASGITNPELRNMFMLENKPRVAAGIERIRDKAFKVETDVQRSHVNARLNGLREVIMGDDETERTQAIRDTKDLLASAKDKGYYSAEEFVNLEKAFTVDAAVGYVNSLPPERQREALESEMSKNNIPSDKRKMMLRGLESREVLAQAQKIAEGARGLSGAEQVKVVNKYSGELKEEVKRQIDYNIRKDKQIQLNTDETLHQNWYLKALNQEKGFTAEELMVNPDFKALPVKYQKDLLMASKAASTPRQQSDPNTIFELHRLRTLADRTNDKSIYEDLRNFYLKNVGNLDSTDMDTWAKVSNEGVVPEEYKHKFTLIQRVDQALARNNLDTKKHQDIALKVRNELDQWDKAYFETNKKDPDQKEIEAQLQRTIYEVSLGDKGMWDTPASDISSPFTTQKIWAEMTPEEQLQVAEETVQNPEDATANNLDIVVNELVTIAEDPVERTRGKEIGLDNYEKLRQDTKAALVNSFKKEDPVIYDNVFNTWMDVFGGRGRYPTEDQILDGIRDIKNATR